MRSHQSGFTLLEVMVALGLLAIGLLWIVEATSRAIYAENHAKMISTATFLARARMVDLEDELLEKGFTDDSFAKETSGDFDDKGFKRFRWTTVIDKVELPNTDQVESLVTKGLQASPMAAALGVDPNASGSSGSSGSGSSGSGAGGLLSGSTGMLSSQFGIIKDVLEQSIRRARVRITWVEGRTEQNLEIVQYLTDPRRVDQTVSIPMGGPGQPAAGGAGTNGTSGTSGSTGTSSSAGSSGSTLKVGP